MTLPELSKLSNIKRSVKKFFIDNLTTTEGFPVHFDIALSPNPLDNETHRWIIVHYGTHDPKQLSSLQLTIYLLSRKDIEGDDLTEMYDTLQNYLYPGQLDIYNNIWVKIGGAKVYARPNQGYNYTWDKTKIQKTFVEIKWGAVW